jgi:hypothetical protein
MSIRENIYQVIDLIKPEHILVSVFDKSGLDELVKGIVEKSTQYLFNWRYRQKLSRYSRQARNYVL